LVKLFLSAVHGFGVQVIGVKCLSSFGKIRYFEKAIEDFINVKQIARRRQNQKKCRRTSKKYLAKSSADGISNGRVFSLLECAIYH
jgi:hypothetical protein